MPTSAAMDSQELAQAGLFFPDHHFCRFDDGRHLVSWLQLHVFDGMPGDGGNQLLTVTQFDDHFGHHSPQMDRFHTASQLIARADLHWRLLLSSYAVDGFQG
jgi:hypothetical protein